MIHFDATDGAVSIARLAGGHLTGRDFVSLRSAIHDLKSAGQSGLLIDLSSMKRLRFTEITRLVELSSIALPEIRLAGFGASSEAAARLAETGADQVFAVFADLAAVWRDPRFKAASLTTTPAIILCDDRCERLGRLRAHSVQPLLDLMGRPLVEQQLRALKSFGIRSVTLAAGTMAPAISDHLHGGGRLGLSLFYEQVAHLLPEAASLVGTALPRLAAHNMALRDDTLVLHSGWFHAFDVREVVEHHKRTGAALTIVRPPFAETEQTVKDARSAGAWVVSPELGELLRDHSGAEVDLASLCRGAGLKVVEFRLQQAVRPVQSVKDYAETWRQALSGEITGISPSGRQIARQVWLAPGAELSSKAECKGSVYVGVDAEVTKGSRLLSMAVVGKGSQVAGVVKNSIILPNVGIAKSAWVDGVIADAEWAIAHSYARTGAENSEPIKGVHRLDSDINTRNQLRIAG